MNKILKLLLIFLLITNCSLNKKSRLWSKSSKIDIEKDFIITELFEDEKKLSEEFNSNVKIKLKSNLTNNNFTSIPDVICDLPNMIFDFFNYVDNCSSDEARKKNS